MAKHFQVTESYDGDMPIVKLTGIEYFDVNKTFDCGQCFRFDRVEDTAHEAEFSGVAFGRFVSFAQDGDTVYIYNSDKSDFEKIWRRFLCLDMDYAEVNGDILAHSEGTVMERAMEYGKGIRILRQDPYEAVISFIISQNNNIPRIKKIIEALSVKCGAPIELCEKARVHMSSVSTAYSFPDAKALIALGEKGLFELKTGFRAKYIYDAVSKIDGGSLDLLSVASLDSTEECIQDLCSVKGIGIKVASCAALFGMGRYDAFPIDVWMKRVAEKYFSHDGKEFSSARFGKYAGIAQQYLFYYERYLGGNGE